MKPSLAIICLLLTNVMAAQKSTLADLLWEEAGGHIDTSEDHGGQYEIVDDAKNGYLKVAFTEEGCGCYTETSVAAYKDNTGNYTTLQMFWDGCGNQKLLSSNKNLISVLPKDIGLHTFLPDTANHNDIDLPALFYLEVSLPQKGINTQIDLKYIPYGIRVTGEDQILSFSGYRQSNTTDFGYHDNLKEVLEKFTDSSTFKYVVNNEQHKIIDIDKQIVSELYGREKTVKNFESLSALFRMLENYYKASKHIEYKSVILGWNRKEARFYIKKKVKNDAPKMSFLEFIRELPFLVAIC